MAFLRPLLFPHANIMLTSHSIKLLGLFSGILIVGLVLGNHIILAMSLVPLCYFLLGLLFMTPTRLDMIVSRTDLRAQVGDTIEIKYEISVNNGLGPVSFFQELPQHFTLLEGNNLRVFWKGWHSRNITFSYKVNCTKRGIYSLSPLHWEANHVLRLRPTETGVLGKTVELTVRPRLMNIRRIRGLPGIATSPFPVIDMAKIGVATTDFREIRNYVYGDPVKNINWKATARNTRPDSWPLTNEYEVEGKKTVWIFQDASRFLEVGTDIENVFEYCLEATHSITYYFLDRGYRVGLYVFNDSGKLFYPDAGKKQFLKISRALINLKASQQLDELPLAVEKCRRYILGYNPLCVIITGLDSRFNDSIIRGVKKLRQLRGRNLHKLPVMVINVPRYNIIPRREIFDENTSLLMQLKTRPCISQLRQLNASVLDWNPKKENFSAAFLKQVKLR
jgi:uncharacterized protein (DUF58 family)